MAKYKVGAVSDIPVGEMARFKLGGESVVVYHLEDGFYATQGRCTHTFGPLHRGKIVERDKVQCPVHHARFDIRSGEVDTWANFPPGIQLLNLVRSEKALKTFAVTVEDGQVFVEL